MSVRNGPLTPTSPGGDGNSNLHKMPPLEARSSQRQNFSPPVRPIVSRGSDTMTGVFPAKGVINLNANSEGPPSPISIARSSGGVRPQMQIERGISRKENRYENILYEHYLALKKYLSASLKDDNINPKPNRARDKLLRLSAVQFQELSTDIYDELVRIQQFERRSELNRAPPPYLPPKEKFHPKRNQARQKLSTLPTHRFKDLATDVFYELERRFPRYASDNVARIRSPSVSTRDPVPRIRVPFNGNRLRQASDASSTTYSMRSDSRSGPISYMNDALPLPSPKSSEFERPTAKLFQSSTIIPNKGTLVEDDETGGEDGEEESREGYLFRSEDATRSELGDIESNTKFTEINEQQIETSNEILSSMEEKSKEKEDELNLVITSQSERISQMENEKKNFQNLITQLENRLVDAQNLNESLRIELDRTKEAHTDTKKDLEDQIQELQSYRAVSDELKALSDTQRENDSLRQHLNQQQLVTEEVRLHAQEILQEMRLISEQSQLSNDREEYFSTNIKRLEDEVKQWRDRYNETKIQLRIIRGYSNNEVIHRDEGKMTFSNDSADTKGMVKSINVIKFQMSIDELLRESRIGETEKIIDLMKSVVFNIQNICQDIVEATSSGREITTQQKKLKFSVTVTTKNLIIASKNFAFAKGLSPISLLDAAASHLTSAVVELLRSVKIRTTPEEELENEEENDSAFFDTNDDSLLRKSDLEKIVSPTSAISPRPFRGLGSVRLSTESSIYSPINSPRDTDPMTPFSSNYESWVGNSISLSPTARNEFERMKSFQSINAVFDVKVPQNGIEQLKLYLEDQTASLIQNVQSLVTAIRSEAGIIATGDSLDAISDVIGGVILNTESTMAAEENVKLWIQGETVVANLKRVQKRLIEAGITGREIADRGRNDDESERSWRSWNQSLPPIAFEIAREMKELVIQVDAMEAISIKDEGRLSSLEDNNRF